ncbi:MAG: PEP/pyruvate-binding domain-containing protein [archaeon]|nr:PEP/pyruvate-binding domain-containing protein [archaeon]
MIPNIKWFREITAKDSALAGNKGANLGELSNEGFNVPPGFIITTTSYFSFLKTNGLTEKISQKILETNEENSEELNSAVEQIQNWINNARMDSFFEKEIKVAYMKLGEKKIAFATSSDEDFVAIRSSPTIEEFSGEMTGEKTSYTNIRGKEDLLKTIKQCWAALFNKKTIPLIKQNNLPIERIGNAVIIQKMINPEFSGTIFTIHPDSGESDFVLIETVYGLREALTNHELSPDVYLMEKKALKLAEEPKISFQDWQIGRTDFGAEKIPVAKNKRDKQKLTDKMILDLTRTARQTEQHFRKAQEIEFAVENNKIYLVQTRTMTHLREKEEPKQEIVEELQPHQSEAIEQAMNETQELHSIEQNEQIASQELIQEQEKQFDSKNYALFLNLTKIKYSMQPMGENEFNAMVQEIAEKLELSENQAIKTLASSIKENKYNKPVLEVLIKDVFEIVAKELEK